MADKAPKKFIINIAPGNDNEPRDVFVGGCEEGDYLITRGKDVTVPASVLERLDHATIGVGEQDPRDPNLVVYQERKRFPYTIVGTVS